MKTQLVFATHNSHKAKEIQAIMPEGIEVLTLDEISCFDEIPETAATLEGNAQLKAAYIANTYRMNCFADDTGLEVESLNGRPGVMSARYAGPAKNTEDNMSMLMNELEGIQNRRAQFRTVIVLFWKDAYHSFEGVVKGHIRLEKSGLEGFGYDPIFEPEACGKTFAEMSLAEKNNRSHRARAFEKMLTFLHQNKE
jgi:XTP/dITP diphosphohydrolase